MPPKSQKSQTNTGSPNVPGKQGVLVVENVPVHDLLPYARNSNVHSDYQVAQLAGSVLEFGFVNPVLIDGDGTIIAGHGRVLAVLKLGWETVPAIRLSHLSEAQRRAYVIADNQLPRGATWDKEMLKVEIQDLSGVGFDLKILGFDAPKLDDILGTGAELDLSNLVGGPAAPAPAAPQPTTSGESGVPLPAASHVRMVQLFLDDVSQPLFLERCAQLQEAFGTETLTDTVLKAVEFAVSEKA